MDGWVNLTHNITGGLGCARLLLNAVLVAMKSTYYFFFPSFKVRILKKMVCFTGISHVFLVFCIIKWKMIHSHGKFGLTVSLETP